MEYYLLVYLADSFKQICGYPVCWNNLSWLVRQILSTRVDLPKKSCQLELTRSSNTWLPICVLSWLKPTEHSPIDSSQPIQVRHGYPVCWDSLSWLVRYQTDPIDSSWRISSKCVFTLCVGTFGIDQPDKSYRLESIGFIWWVDSSGPVDGIIVCTSVLVWLVDLSEPTKWMLLTRVDPFECWDNSSWFDWWVIRQIISTGVDLFKQYVRTCWFVGMGWAYWPNKSYGLESTCSNKYLLINRVFGWLEPAKHFLLTQVDPFK